MPRACRGLSVSESAGTGAACPGTASTGSERVVDETQNRQGQTGMKNDGPQTLTLTLKLTLR